MKQIAVFGLGILGKNLAEKYAELGGKVIAIDIEQRKVDEIADSVNYAICADASDEIVFKEIDLSDVDVAVVTMGDHFEASVVTTTMCKEAGIPHVIAKASNNVQARILKKVGADEIALPEIEKGHRMAKDIANAEKFTDIADISDEFSIIEVTAPKAWVGKSLREINVRENYGLNVIAVKENGKFRIELDVNKPCKEDTELVVLGTNEKIKKVFK